MVVKSATLVLAPLVLNRTSSPDGERVTEAATGDGPVHALFAALARGTGIDLDIESYQVSSVTTGVISQLLTAPAALPVLRKLAAM